MGWDWECDQVPWILASHWLFYRVAVLENQNKALIEELKSLKELYTGGIKHKGTWVHWEEKPPLGCFESLLEYKKTKN